MKKNNLKQKQKDFEEKKIISHFFAELCYLKAIATSILSDMSSYNVAYLLDTNYIKKKNENNKEILTKWKELIKKINIYKDDFRKYINLYIENDKNSFNTLLLHYSDVRKDMIDGLKVLIRGLSRVEDKKIYLIMREAIRNLIQYTNNHIKTVELLIGINLDEKENNVIMDLILHHLLLKN